MHVREALEALSVGRTTIIIAHRLSSVERADCIAVLAAGKIVDKGTHSELLARNNLYAGLYRFQLSRTQNDANTVLAQDPLNRKGNE